MVGLKMRLPSRRQEKGSDWMAIQVVESRRSFGQIDDVRFFITITIRPDDTVM